MYRIIGVDIGSFTIKAAIFDLDSGAVTHLTRKAFPDRIAGLPPHHFEVDPDEVVRRVAGVINHLATAAPDVDSISCYGQMGGVLLCDQKLRQISVGLRLYGGQLSHVFATPGRSAGMATTCRFRGAGAVVSHTATKVAGSLPTAFPRKSPSRKKRFSDS